MRSPNPRAFLLVAVVIIVAVALGIGFAMLSGIRGPGPASASASPPAPTASEHAPATESIAPSVSPAPSEAPSSAPTPAVTVAPSPTPLPSGAAQVAWSAGERQDGRVSAVIDFDGTWIAGGAIHVGTTSRAAVWRSTDGLEWTDPVLLPPEPVESEGFYPRYWVNGFGTWDGTLLAFGWKGVGCCDGGYPMLWQSADGDTWAEVDTAGTAFGDAYHFPQTSLTTDDGRLVVLSLTSLGNSASIFSTTDLATWTAHPVTSADPTFTFQQFAASPNGWLAVGSATPPWTDRPRPEQRLWSSADGLAWTPIEPPAPGGMLNDIAWDGARGRFVIVGFDAEGLPAVWLTADGRAWSRTTLAEQPGSAESVSAADGLLVIGAHEGAPSQTVGRGVAWSSHDGVSWRAVPLTDRGSPITATTSDRAVVVLNLASDSLAESWEGWAGTIAD